MHIQKNRTRILRSIAVDFTFADLAEQLLRTPSGEKILEMARPIFERVRGSWSPDIVLCPMRVNRLTQAEVELMLVESRETIKLAMGWSGGFLRDAELVIAGGYTTIGEKLEKVSAVASKNHHYIDAYVTKQIGLAILGKTGVIINTMIGGHSCRK